MLKDPRSGAGSPTSVQIQRGETFRIIVADEPAADVELQAEDTSGRLKTCRHKRGPPALSGTQGISVLSGGRTRSRPELLTLSRSPFQLDDNLLRGL